MYLIQIASHLSVISPLDSRAQAQKFFNTLTECRTPLAFFEPELRRTMPRHYVLFALQAIFLVADLIGRPPPPEILTYLEGLIDSAQTVKIGDLEKHVNADMRYFAQLRWFERILSRWNRRQLADVLPDGQGWEGDWTDRSKMMWRLM